jgi:dTDP-4-dehydrorhamnose reductase
MRPDRTSAIARKSEGLVMPKIFAVVLTYNRKDLLQRCLEAITRQSCPCNRIVVIDNGSSDGTAEMLRQDWAGRVHTYVLSRNIGASGGYNAGMRIAYQEGAEFIWAMDDDVIPEEDALERLVEGDNFLAQRGVAHAFVLSTAWTETGAVTNVPKIDTRPVVDGYENWPMYLKFKMMPVTRATFVSILLPRSTIAEFGLPLAPMFIWGEDSEYTMRITKKNPGFVVAESRVAHLRAQSGAVSILTETNKVRIGYHRHFVRNHLYTARVHSPKLHFLKQVIKQVQVMLRLASRFELNKAGIVFTGFMEGLWFHPKIEPADASIDSLGVTVRTVL